MPEVVKAEKPSVPVDFYWTVHAVEDKKDSEGRFFEGYCSTDDIDLSGERVTPNCMAKVVSALPGTVVLFNHDIDRPVGRVLSALVDEKGLYIKGLVSKTEGDLWNKVQEGIISKMSIRLRNREGGLVRGGNNTKDVYEITNMTVPEVSLTPLPCCMGATIAVAYGKTMTFKEGEMAEINVDQILKVMQEAVKDITAQNSIEAIKESVFETLKGFISGSDDKAAISEDILKEQIVEALKSQTVAEDQQASVAADLLVLSKDYLKEAAAPPAPKPEDLLAIMGELKAALDSLSSRVSSLEEGSKSLSEALPKSIAAVISSSVDALKAEIKGEQEKTAASAKESYEKIATATKDVNDRLDSVVKTDEGLSERVKSIESIVPSRLDGNVVPAVNAVAWKGVFPF